MRARRKTPRRAVFVQVGALLVGGLAGGAISYMILGDVWFWNAVFAAAGALLAQSLAERMLRKPRKRK